MFPNQQAINDQSALQAYLPANLANEVPDGLCKKLARTHYENFPVGSIFLPKELRQHVFNIYAYCRVCDDLADESGDPELSINLLEWWRQELYDCYKGNPRYPVFVALRHTINTFDLPIQPFEDLISAFLQDQRVTRYETFEDLLGYCTRSANPVGRLFLYLLGYRDEARQKLSDYTCTALQLVNFWQDIPVDYKKGRIYIPMEDMKRVGYTESELSNHIFNPGFIKLMRFEIERTRELFVRGAQLQCFISGKGAADVELFTTCGIALLDSIEKRNFNVFKKHITVPKLTKTILALKWASRHFADIMRREE